MVGVHYDHKVPQKNRYRREGGLSADLTTQVEALRRLPLFAAIELSKLKLLAFTSEVVRFADGQALFAQEEPSVAAFVLLSGRIDVEIATAGGTMPLSSLNGSGIVGEVGVLCDRPRMATARAVGDVVTLRINRDAFFRLIDEFPQMAVCILRDVAMRLDFTTRELARARS